MWKKPWKYAEGIAIVVGLVLVGLMLQLSAGPLDWDIFMWPANAITMVLLLVALALMSVLSKKIYLFSYMATMPAAVPAIAAAALLTMVMGLTKQVAPGATPADGLGLTKMLSFWPFVLVYFWMTMIVGLVTVKQLEHPSWRKLPVIISHAGLFIALTCATLGSADMQRLKMYCEQDQPEWRALDEWNNVHELPVAIELKKFTIEEYPPKLLIINQEGKPLPLGKGKSAQLMLEQGVKGGRLMDYDIKVEQLLPDGVPTALLKMVDAMPEGMMKMVRMDSLGMVVNKGSYINKKMPGAAPAVYVTVTGHGHKHQGWVTCGSYQFPYQGLPLTDGQSLVMGEPEPQRYLSQVMVYTPDGQGRQAEISVNHPLSVNGWKIYQLSYNEQMGRWSTLSVFELVRDPWLPATYVGIGLLMLGALGMFLTPSRKKGKEKEPSNESKEERRIESKDEHLMKGKEAQQ